MTFLFTDLEQLQAPIDLGEAVVRVSASIGIALAPDHARTAKELLEYADTAMYRAKRRRSGFAVYEAELDEHRVDRLRLAVELADALERDELVIHYQPAERVNDGTPVSAEALVRWQHPTRGLLGPDQFLPAAQHNRASPSPSSAPSLRSSLAACRPGSLPLGTCALS